MDSNYDFDHFFHQATERAPYPYQRVFAEDGDLPELLNIPTGVGKTGGGFLAGCIVVVTNAPSTPRRLIYCLPMRTLVEQTRDCALIWLDRLGLLAGTVQYSDETRTRIQSYDIDLKQDPNAVGVFLLMGGADGGNWDQIPSQQILIGTQDMLLSRGSQSRLWDVAVPLAGSFRAAQQ